MLWIIERGHDREWVMGLTIQQIADLYGFCERLEARDAILISQMVHVATQGQSKDLKKFLVPVRKILRKSRTGRTLDNDVQAFNAKYGGGF